MKLSALLTMLAFLSIQSVASSQPFLGNGIKIGETTADSTIIWLRLTDRAEPNWSGLKWMGTEDRDFDVGKFGENQFPQGASLNDMEGSLPGMAGTARIAWWPKGKPDARKETRWIAVDPLQDFTAQVALENLKPNQAYLVEVTCKSVRGDTGQKLNGSFRTAQGPTIREPFKFVITTCQSWKTRDKGTAGLQIYDHMLDLDPAFFMHLGDIVYYDKNSTGGDVDALSPELARFHWNRWHGCSDIVDFHNNVPSFFIKDDHDTLTNDAWPEMKVGNLDWQTGLAIFLEQVPITQPTYRSRRWSKDLHFWMVEGRDYRTPNKEPDGPDKSIWGPEQKAWFKREVLASDAPFKILFSPTPVVGPDRDNKKDNHSNKNWSFEGEELRKFCAENNVIVIVGDRHWQYHSIDDETGVHEFACGAASEAHAGGYSLDLRTGEHQYLAIIGGFLSGEIIPDRDRTNLIFRHHRVDGSVAYEYAYSRSK